MSRLFRFGEPRASKGGALDQVSTQTCLSCNFTGLTLGRTFPRSGSQRYVTKESLWQFFVRAYEVGCSAVLRKNDFFSPSKNWVPLIVLENAVLRSQGGGLLACRAYPASVGAGVCKWAWRSCPALRPAAHLVSLSPSGLVRTAAAPGATVPLHRSGPSPKQQVQALPSPAWSPGARPPAPGPLSCVSFGSWVPAGLHSGTRALLRSRTRPGRAYTLCSRSVCDGERDPAWPCSGAAGAASQLPPHRADPSVMAQGTRHPHTPARSETGVPVCAFGLSAPPGQLRGRADTGAKCGEAGTPLWCPWPHHCCLPCAVTSKASATLCPPLSLWGLRPCDGRVGLCGCGSYIAHMPPTLSENPAPLVSVSH